MKVWWHLARSVFALLDKDRSHAVPHACLDICKNLWLIIYGHVMVGWILLRYLFQVLLFMHIQQDATLYYICQVAMKNLFGLEEHITI